MSNFAKKKLFFLLFIANVSFAQFPSLVTPVGARQLGMGEAFIGLANDVYATYWNPAGLAFGPLSDEWVAKPKNTVWQSKYNLVLPSLISQKGTQLFSRNYLWASEEDRLLFFNGKEWRDYLLVTQVAKQPLKELLAEYTGIPLSDSLLQIVRQFNQLDTFLNLFDRKIKLPYNLLFAGKNITTLLVDKNQRLWVGTEQGLFRLDKNRWKSFLFLKIANSNQSLHITSLNQHKSFIWIGTQDGLYRYRRGRFIQRGKKLLPSLKITAIASHPKSSFVFVAHGAGVARYTLPSNSRSKGKWKLFDTTDGLLSSKIIDLKSDAQGKLWVAHLKGVSHLSLLDWSRFRFNDQIINRLGIDKQNNIWVATNKGVWRYVPKGSKEKTKRGDWIHYHVGNGPSSNDNFTLAIQDNQVWFVNPKNIDQYKFAKSQVAFFYEGLLPALQLQDLFHAFLTATFPLNQWGTVGGFINFISFGSTQTVQQDGSQSSESNSSIEFVGGLSYGTKIGLNNSLGVNFKFLYSSLVPGGINGNDGIATSYAIDFGFLFKEVLFQNLDVGVVLQNMGPGISYVENSQANAIPFTWRLGLTYQLLNLNNHEFRVLSDFNRETISENISQTETTPFYISAWKDVLNPFGADKSNPTFSEVLQQNLRKMVYNFGAEYVYSQSIALRSGYLLDLVGQRKEVHFGAGFFVSDVLQINGALIRDVGGGIRGGQSRFDLIFQF